MAADLRIIAPATTPTAPAYPKKLPIVVLATLSALLLSAGVALARRSPQPEVAATSEQGAEAQLCAAEGVGAVEAAGDRPNRRTAGRTGNAAAGRYDRCAGPCARAGRGTAQPPSRIGRSRQRPRSAGRAARGGGT
ncbi:MAG: hypothetical protein MZV49_02935 [Rhodopseudomonas palustris]|nr:hypothetical protein [Rhodopseudomonas palustris]